MLPKRDLVGLLIGAARRKIKHSVSLRAGPHKLSTLQFWALVALQSAPGLSLSELAERQRMEMPNASRVVTSLVKRRLVKLKRDPADRRRAVLELTAGGEQLAKKLERSAELIREAQVAGMTEQEVETLRALLHRVIENLETLDSKLDAGSAGKV